MSLMYFIEITFNGSIMKTAIILLSALLSFGASASQDKCFELSGLVQSIMDARQRGMPMQQVLTILKGEPSVTPIVIEAYKVPHFGSPQFKQRAVTEFTNEFLVTCLEVTAK